MFKKEYKIKAISSVRSSDRRKLITEIQTKFNIEFTPEQLESVIPKELSSTRFFNHIGKQGTLYFCNQEPSWLRINDELILPSVYTLWKIPNLLPKLYTNKFVLSKLINGADLMIPGIYIPEEGLPDLPKNSIVSICVIGEGIDNQFPYAVGVLAVDTKDITSEEKGKGVQTVHTFSNHLWLQGSKSKPEELFVPGLETEQDNEKDVESELINEVEKINISPPNSKEESTIQLKTQEIDEIIIASLYQSLHTLLDEEKSKGLLPIPITTLYSNYILPCRPIGIEVDIKDSSFKKLGKFIKAMEKKNILALKEVKGTLFVKSINYECEELITFIPVKKSKTKQAEEQEDKSLPKSEQEKISCIEIYQLTSDMIPIFQSNVNEDWNGKMLTKVEIFTGVKKYIDAKKLVDKSRRGAIKLDQILLNALNIEVTEKLTYLSLDQIKEKLISIVKPYYELKLPGKEATIEKGIPTPINIKLQQRLGSKVVTLVTNFEPYGYDSEILSKKFMELCASSVAVTALPSKKKLPSKEILIQGPQDKILKEYFIKDGLKSNLIKIENLQKKKK